MLASQSACRRLVAFLLGAVGSVRLARSAIPSQRLRSRATSCVCLFVLFVLALTSCGGSVGEDADARERLGSVAQALTDTDADGMDDAWETLHFGNLSQTAAGDFDADGMTNGEEHQYGFNPTVNDAFEDADGDRYPNVFEIRGGADPNVSTSVPAATYTVNGSGGGTHTTIKDAVTAANVDYQIIAIAPGVYTGVANSNITIPSTKPKLLFIGLEGAAKTIIDGGLADWGWQILNSAVISSLTFRKTWSALFVNLATAEVRFVDLVVRDNANSAQYAAGVNVGSAARVHIVGSTFLNNTGLTSSHQIYIGAGAATMVNTVVSGASGTMLAKAASATLTTNYSLVTGQTLTGTGNLAGSVDPKLRSDLHLLWDSPLRGAGGSVTQSRIDIDRELRPSSAPDIGGDQFNDSDSDGLADRWELDEAGNLTTLTSRTQDADGDGLTNDQEYVAITKPTVADTDRDQVNDGVEVAIGTNPLVADSDSLASDLNQDGLIDSVGAQVGYQPDLQDDDGDGTSNADELLMCTNPLRADSDGDGVPDSTDAFPLDPLKSALPSNSLDVTAPVITLTAPWYAVPQ